MTNDPRDKVKSEVRASLAKTSPGLLAFMNLARERFGARVTYIETPEIKIGRRPSDWRDEIAEEKP